MNRLILTTTLLALFGAAAGGCQSAYYGMMETFGVEKRDILVDRVVDARDEQQEAKEQFASALDHFLSVVNYEGGELEDQYRSLNASYEDSAAEAEDVREEIASVEGVAEALFEEWEDELEEYQSTDLRRASERRLDETRRRYNELIDAMNDAASKMDPVLAALHDQVLFLKHNLNARAIASLQDTAATLEADVAQLIEEMEQSIARADAFIQEMGVE